MRGARADALYAARSVARGRVAQVALGQNPVQVGNASGSAGRSPCQLSKATDCGCSLTSAAYQCLLAYGRRATVRRRAGTRRSSRSPSRSTARRPRVRRGSTSHPSPARCRRLSSIRCPQIWWTERRNVRSRGSISRAARRDRTRRDRPARRGRTTTPTCPRRARQPPSRTESAAVRSPADSRRTRGARRDRRSPIGEDQIGGVRGHRHHRAVEVPGDHDREH